MISQCYRRRLGVATRTAPTACMKSTSIGVLPTRNCRQCAQLASVHESRFRGSVQSQQGRKVLKCPSTRNISLEQGCTWIRTRKISSVRSSARMVLVITEHPGCCGKSRPVAGSGESEGHWHSTWRRLRGCSSLSPADVSATPEAGGGVLLGGDEDIVRGSGGGG